MRAFRILLALAATGALGAWLVRTPRTTDEILIACAGWVLGFWVAASLLGFRRPADATVYDIDDEDEEEEDDGWDEEDWAEDDEADR